MGMTSFTKMFEQALLNKFYLDKSERSTDHNHPSELTACLRKFWYKINDTPISDPPSPSMLMIWNQGHALQDVMEDLLTYVDIRGTVAFERKVVDEEYNVGGHIDLLFSDRGQVVLMDFKTTGATKFKEIKRGKYPSSYKWQLNHYMYLLKKENPKQFKELDRAYLFFINKSPVPDEIFLAQNKPRMIQSPFFEIEVKYDEDLIETEILPQLEYMEEIRETNEIPDKSNDEQECMFCEFRSICKGGKK
jgi:CRISPR/Cas system-associated exonuclease Cas4 (RecB family)